MEAYDGANNTGPPIPRFGIIWRLVGCFTLCSFYPQKKNPWYTLSKRPGAPVARLDIIDKVRSLASLAGIRTASPLAYSLIIARTAPSQT
jgi:hypothetical protein